MSVKPTLGLEFPNLPYFIDGDFKMTETLAIHHYIADKWCPDLLGATPEERARITMACGPVTSFKMSTTMPCYMSGNVDDIKKAC